MELAPQSRASIAGKSKGLAPRKPKYEPRRCTSKVNITRKLSVMLNYVLDLSDYALDCPII